MSSCDTLMATNRSSPEANSVSLSCRRIGLRDAGKLGRDRLCLLCLLLGRTIGDLVVGCRFVGGREKERQGLVVSINILHLEGAEHDLVQLLAILSVKELPHDTSGDGRSLAARVSVDSSADSTESDAAAAVLDSELQAGLVAALQLLLGGLRCELIVDGADGVDDLLARQVIGAGDLG